MFTHDQIWAAIDHLAKDRGYSASGLARQAGLDPTSFNRSKRTSPSGKPRWPSTESIAKILAVTACPMGQFLALGGIDVTTGANTAPRKDNAPGLYVVDLATLSGGRNPMAARDGGAKTDGKAASPLLTAAAAHHDAACFATHIDNNRFAPLFRKGTDLLMDSKTKPATGDRVLFFSRRDGLGAGIIMNTKPDGWDISRPGGARDNDFLSTADIAWMARIILATQ